MVVVDNLGAGPDVLDEAKAMASAKTGIPTNRMLICSTHTHTGSSLNTNSVPGVAYRKRFVEGVASAIIDAHAKLRPAAFGAAAHPLPEEVFNRRWYLKPGRMPPNPFGLLDTVKMNPGTNPDVLDRPAGPTDPDITVISIQDAKKKPLALFANSSLHCVGGSPKGEMSADYFGEFARLMPTRMKGDDDFVAMMSNGASGDTNNIPFLVTRPPGVVDNPALIPFIVSEPSTLPGIVVDETAAKLEGRWQHSTHTPPYVGIGYLHDRKDGQGQKSITFTPALPSAGRYEVRLAHCYNIRRATNTSVTIHHADGETILRINQQEIPAHEKLFRSLGAFRFHAGSDGWVKISAAGTAGKYVMAEAVQWLPVSGSNNAKP
jgi:hypothetical protein